MALSRTGRAEESEALWGEEGVWRDDGEGGEERRERTRRGTQWLTLA